MLDLKNNMKKALQIQFKAKINRLKNKQVNSTNSMNNLSQT